jgi:hypothetical protein
MTNVDNSSSKSKKIPGGDIPYIQSCALSSILRVFSCILYFLILCFLTLLTLKFGYGSTFDYIILFIPLFGISIFFVILMGMLSFMVCVSGNVDLQTSKKELKISVNKKVRHQELHAFIKKSSIKISDIFTNETFLIYCIFGNPFMTLFYFTLYGGVSFSTLVVNDKNFQITDSSSNNNDSSLISLLALYLTDSFSESHTRNMTLTLVLVPLLLEIMAVMYVLGEIIPVMVASSENIKTKLKMWQV